MLNVAGSPVESSFVLSTAVESSLAVQWSPVLCVESSFVLSTAVESSPVQWSPLLCRMQLAVQWSPGLC